MNTDVKFLSASKNFFANVSSGSPSIVYASGPTYVGPNSINLLFPFSISSGVLEVALVNNFSVSGSLPQNMGATVKLSGSQQRVSNIGPNFKSYIKNRTWGDRTITNVNSISVFTPAQMTQVQQLDETFVGHMNEVSYKVTGGAPPSNFALQFSGFGVTWAFLTPLVIRATDSTGHMFYITFVTSWSQ